MAAFESSIIHVFRRRFFFKYWKLKNPENGQQVDSPKMASQILKSVNFTNTQKSRYLKNKTFFVQMRKLLNIKGYFTAKNSFVVEVTFNYSYKTFLLPLSKLLFVGWYVYTDHNVKLALCKLRSFKYFYFFQFDLSTFH